MAITLNQLRLLISKLRREDFDTTTVEGRSKKRYRRAALTTLASVLSKGISMATILISVPLTLNYLGSERYGLWMTLSSLVFMLGFADLGMGLGLMNAISEAHGKDDDQAAAYYVSSGFYMLTGMATLIFVFFIIVYPHIPWPKLLNIKSTLASQESGPAIAVFIACFTLNLPLSVVQRIQLGYQEGFLNNLWDSSGKLLSLLGLLVVIYFQAGMVWLIVAVAGSPLLAATANSFMLFIKKRPWLRPRLKYFHLAFAIKILKIGLLFFTIQIATTILNQIDNVLLANMIGPEAVSQFSVHARLFLLIIMIAGFFLGPLWPAYSEAIARGDVLWVKRTFKRSLILGFVVSLFPSGMLIIFGPQILSFWVGSEIAPSFSLLIGFGIWSVINVIFGAYAMLFNATNRLLFLSICSVLVIGAKISLSIILIKFLGIAGAIYGSVISCGMFYLLPSLFYLPLLFKNNYTT